MTERLPKAADKHARAVLTGTARQSTERALRPRALPGYEVTDSRAAP